MKYPSFVSRFVLRIWKQYLSRLHVLDWALVVMACLFVGFLLFLRLQREEEWIPVRVQVGEGYTSGQTEPVESWYAQSLSAGDVGYNYLGNEIVRVRGVENINTGGDSQKQFVDLEVKATFNSKKKNYIFEGRTLASGQALDLEIGDTRLEGVIVFVYDKDVAYSQKIITVEAKRLEPWLADSFYVGQKLTDTAGNVYAEVLAVRSEAAQVEEFSDIRGQYIMAELPESRDVEMTIQLSAHQIGDVYQFITGSTLRTGEEIWFFFDDALLPSARVVEVVQ